MQFSKPDFNGHFSKLPLGVNVYPPKCHYLRSTSKERDGLILNPFSPYRKSCLCYISSAVVICEVEIVSPNFIELLGWQSEHKMKSAFYIIDAQ